MRKLTALDPLDADPEPPPGLGLIRFCGAPKCRRRARPGGRHCHDHHTATNRRWREHERDAINTRRRARADVRSEAQRLADSARAKLAMAIRRGTIVRGRCVLCGTRERVTGYAADPAMPLAVEWVCREDRAELIARRRTDAQQAAERDAWAARRTRALERLTLLPPEVRAAIEAAATRGPAGWELNVGSQIYLQQLVRLVEKHD